MKYKAFTLIEVLIAVTIFSLVIIASSSTFALVFGAWQRQKNALDILRDGAWALEFVSNEVRLAAATGLGRLRTYHSGERIAFWLDSNGDGIQDKRIWYWRGNGSTYGERDIFYRGEGMSLLLANINRQEVAENITDNPSSGSIFSLSSGLLTFEITLAKGGKSYTLRTKIRARNR